MVSDNENKMSSFQSAVRGFKKGESTAKGMIDTIYHVLDRDAQATASIVREVGSIFEQDGDKDKAKSILEAINGFRAEVSHMCMIMFAVSLLTRSSKKRNSQRSADQARAATMPVSHQGKSSGRRTQHTLPASTEVPPLAPFGTG